MANLKIDQPSGKKYFLIERSTNPIQDVFKRIFKHFAYGDDLHPELFQNPAWAREYARCRRVVPGHCVMGPLVTTLWITFIL